MEFRKGCHGEWAGVDRFRLGLSSKWVLPGGSVNCHLSASLLNIIKAASIQNQTENIVLQA